jgi:hypothetical protein
MRRFRADRENEISPGFWFLRLRGSGRECEGGNGAQHNS